jgi:MerR family copper efflux transcriptional regulator
MGHKVGAAARAAGVGVQTLHFYEREGLVGPAGRTEAGYRLYDLDQIARIRAIKRAQSLGFTLAEISDLIAIADSRRSSTRVQRLAEAKLAEIGEKIEALETMRDALRAGLESCRCGGDLTHCDLMSGLGEAAATPGNGSAGRSPATVR